MFTSITHTYGTFVYLWQNQQFVEFQKRIGTLTNRSRVQFTRTQKLSGFNTRRMVLCTTYTCDAYSSLISTINISNGALKNTHSFRFHAHFIFLTATKLYSSQLDGVRLNAFKCVTFQCYLSKEKNIY